MNADDDRLPTLLIIPLIQLFVVVFLFIALLNGYRELTVLGIVVLTILACTKNCSRLIHAKFHHEIM